MECKRILAVIFLFSLLVFIFGYDFYYSYSTVETKTIPLELMISDHPSKIGVDPSPEFPLYLGKIPIGGSGTRNFTVANDYNHSLKVDIKSTGDISQFLVISDNHFILKESESRELRISAIPSLSPDPQPGNYSGDLTIIFRKPLIT